MLRRAQRREEHRRLLGQARGDGLVGELERREGIRGDGAQRNGARFRRPYVEHWVRILRGPRVVARRQKHLLRILLRRAGREQRQQQRHGAGAVVGVSGAEAGVRGFVDAYDSATGERLWRFHTIPAPGDLGSETWQGDAWQTGGGSTWLTGSYDPDLDLLYWTVGNPAPDWNGDVRPGDNLFSCSIIALDPNTGELNWHFQFTPHDTHDWDANQIPVLFDAEFNDEDRKLVALANRNAFFYLLDRETGEFLHGNEYSKQTWATGLDEAGRPIVIPGSEPTYDGNLVWPSLQGATNWFSPSYNPVTEQFFVATRLMGSVYYKADVEYEEGQPFLGGGEQALSGDDAAGAIRALDVMTGRQQWEFMLHSP